MEGGGDGGGGHGGGDGGGHDAGGHHGGSGRHGGSGHYRDSLSTERAVLDEVNILLTVLRWPDTDLDGLSETERVQDLDSALARLGPQQQVGTRTELLKMWRERGDQAREAEELVKLGAALTALKRFDDAAEACTQALYLWHALSDRSGQAAAWTGFGAALKGAGRFEEALGAHRQALALVGETGDRALRNRILRAAGETLAALGRFQRAGHGQRRVPRDRRHLPGPWGLG